MMKSFDYHKKRSKKLEKRVGGERRKRGKFG